MNIAIIGSGPGGRTAALEAKRLGAEVTLIEERKLGGVCLNEGCIPIKQLLVYGFELRKSKKFLDEVTREMRPDWADWIQAQKAKKAVVEKLSEPISLLLRANEIRVIYGSACFQNPNTLSVYTPEGEEKIIQPNKVIIAAGSRPKNLKVLEEPEGIRESVLDTSKALELEKVPKSLIMIGGGVSGLEFATLFNLFGAEVTVVEQEKSLLPGFDEKMGREIALHLKALGMKIFCGAKCLAAMLENGFVKLKLDNGQEISGEKILVAIGRNPNSANLLLENAGVEKNSQGFILVNEKMETNIAGIYAVGDVAGKFFLASVAAKEGGVAARNALGQEAKMDYSNVSQAIWTIPQIAVVGLSEKEAKAQGIQTSVSQSWFRANPLAHILGEPDGFAQIVREKSTRKILGGQIIGAEASELIHIISEEMAKDGREPCFFHPALAETIKEAIK